MTNSKCDHNGYYRIPGNQLTFISCNDLLNPSSSFSTNFRKQFPCNIFFILLFIIQISSTCLMFVSVALTFKMISADSQFLNQSSKALKNFTLNSGTNRTNIIESNRDFLRIFLRRIRSLSNDTGDNTLTKDSIDRICLQTDLVQILTDLHQMTLSFCKRFKVIAVMYSELVDLQDRQQFTNISFHTMNFTDSTDTRLNELIPELLLHLENEMIMASKKSVRQSVSDNLSNITKCTEFLTRLLNKDNDIRYNCESFDHTLRRNHCAQTKYPRNSSIIFCKDCEVSNH